MYLLKGRLVAATKTLYVPLVPPRRMPVRCWGNTRVVVGVHVVGDPDLLLVAGALDLGRLRLRPAQRREEHAGQDRDDGDDHQQFDQGKTAAPMRGGKSHGRVGGLAATLAI
jgi:hypothetical protein